MRRGLDGIYLPFFACVQFSSLAEASVSQVFGGHSEGETPLPIPNRAVKPLSADGTWPGRAWESRSPPILDTEPPRCGRLFFARARACSGRGPCVVLLQAVGFADWSSWSRTTQA